MQQEQVLAQEPIDEQQEWPPVARPHSAGRDQELQLVRRVDWRFLLPDPRLRHMAYLGPKKGLLLQALQHFSESFSIISWSELPDYRPGIHSGFDLAIAHSPKTVDLEGIRSILSDGGYLYWEIDRSSWGRRWRMHHFRDYVTALEKLGFDDICANWHRPNFDSSLEIIPLDDEHALRYVLSGREGNAKGRIQVAAGRFLVRSLNVRHQQRESRAHRSTLVP